MRPSTPLWWVVLAVGCTDAEPMTTDGECGQSEVEVGIALADGSRDVLLVVEPELGRVLEPQLRQFVLGIATGKADDHPQHQLRRDAELRVAVLATSDAAAVLRALPESAPVPLARFTRYRHAPFGYGEDAEAFVARALCPLREDQPCEAVTSLPDEPFAFGSAFLDIFVVSDRDACRSGERSWEASLACSEALASLIDAYDDYRDQGWSQLTLIAGIPSELATLEAFRSPESSWLSALLEDPRMHAARDGDLCAGTGLVSAQAAPVLFERMADMHTAIASVCSRDFRSALAMSDCGHVDRAQPTWPERIGRDAAGLATCEWREMLPADGLITRCAQLADFGRAAEPVEVVDGREVCVIDQIAEADAETSYGWFVPSRDEFRSSWVNDLDTAPEPLCPEYRSIDRGMPALSWTTAAAPHAQLTLRCRLETGDARSCE